MLTEDQQGNEKRVDIVKQVSHNLIKKITALLEAPPGTDPEKRLVGSQILCICTSIELKHVFLEHYSPVVFYQRMGGWGGGGCNFKQYLI